MHCRPAGLRRPCPWGSTGQAPGGGGAHRDTPELPAQRAARLARSAARPSLFRGAPNRREVALTFDDGPHPGLTPRLLATLAQQGVRATFFVVGETAKAHPQLVRAEVAAGHLVANHTYHHVNLTRVPPNAVAAEIRACDIVLKAITGRTPVSFRPPGGDYNRRVTRTAQALGHTMVLWTDDPADCARPGARRISLRTLGRVGNGGIILLHDGVQQTLDVLSQIIHKLKARGYRFVTCDQMVGTGSRNTRGASPARPARAMALRPAVAGRACAAHLLPRTTGRHR